jgi:hypothetical protein
MARHNREGHGADQLGHTYVVSYQPDWLRHVKVTRDLDTGRQSTKTLLKNPATTREAEPGSRVRTRITSQDRDMAFEVAVFDPGRAVCRIRVTYLVDGKDGGPREGVEFTLEGCLPED